VFILIIVIHIHLIRAKLEREYEDMNTRIFAKDPKQFPPEQFTVESFLWAFVMLLSRAARLSSKSSGEELALVPYADLMNHNPYSNTYIDAQRSGMPLISRTEVPHTIPYHFMLI
jgi:histone-lysine N-methyltransferase SETD3